MSRTVYTIANVLHSLMILKEKIPSKEWGETPLPRAIRHHSATRLYLSTSF